MKAWAGLILPISLGILAAAFNLMTMMNRMAPTSFLVAHVEIAEGQKVKLEHFRVQNFQVPEDFQHMAVREQDKYTILGRPARTKISAGSVVFHSQFSESIDQRTLPEHLRAVAFQMSKLRIESATEIVPDSLLYVRVRESETKSRAIATPFRVIEVSNHLDGQTYVTLALPMTGTKNEKFSSDSERLQEAYEDGRITRSHF